MFVSKRSVTLAASHPVTSEQLERRLLRFYDRPQLPSGNSSSCPGINERRLWDIPDQAPPGHTLASSNLLTNPRKTVPEIDLPAAYLPSAAISWNREPAFIDALSTKRWTVLLMRGLRYFKLCLGFLNGLLRLATLLQLGLGHVKRGRSSPARAVSN